MRKRNKPSTCRLKMSGKMLCSFLELFTAMQKKQNKLCPIFSRLPLDMKNELQFSCGAFDSHTHKKSQTWRSVGVETAELCRRR